MIHPATAADTMVAAAAYLMCLNMYTESKTFGVFGLKVHKESQSTNGEPDGSRVTSGANFRFNIFNINFGLGVHTHNFDTQTGPHDMEM